MANIRKSFNFRSGLQVDTENFIVNENSATADDVSELAEVARRAVRAKFSVDLHWEVKRIGEW